MVGRREWKMKKRDGGNKRG
jgi:hypothetical protein